MKDNYKWHGLFAILIATFSVLLSLSFLFPASPIIMKEFSVDMETVSWLSLSYAISSSIFAPIFGKTADIFGRKKNILIGVIIFTVAQILAAISPNIILMIIARFIQGIGAASVMPVGMAFIRENFEKNERGKALGVWGMVISVGPAIGPILAGYLIEHLGWRYIFWVSSLFGVISYIAIHLVVRESEKFKNQKIDFFGAIILFLCISSFIILTNKINQWGINSFLSLSFFSIFLVLFFLFIYIEKRIKSPLIDLNLIKSSIFVFASMTGFIAFLIFQGSFFLMPFFLQHIQNYLPSETGLIILPLSISLMLSTLIIGWLSDKLSLRLLTFSGMLIVILSISFLLFVTIEASFVKISLIFGVLGFGIGSTFPTMSKAITNEMPLSQLGASVGVFNMIRNLGSPLGVALVTAIFSNKMRYYMLAENQIVEKSLKHVNLPFYEVGIILLIIAMLGAITALFVEKSKEKQKDFSSSSSI